MTPRAPAIVVLAATAVVAAGCGGGNGGGDGEAAGGGACGAAKTELRDTIAERDRLFVDLQLEKATTACEGELEAVGEPGQCAAARADLEGAAAKETPPGDLDTLVDSAVEACVGTKITSTIPAP
jgi:hypothetical protein